MVIVNLKKSDTNYIGAIHIYNIYGGDLFYAKSSYSNIEKNEQNSIKLPFSVTFFGWYTDKRFFISQIMTYLSVFIIIG